MDERGQLGKIRTNHGVMDVPSCFADEAAHWQEDKSGDTNRDDCEESDR